MKNTHILKIPNDSKKRIYVRYPKKGYLYHQSKEGKNDIVNHTLLRNKEKFRKIIKENKINTNIDINLLDNNGKSNSFKVIKRKEKNPPT